MNKHKLFLMAFVFYVIWGLSINSTYAIDWNFTNFPATDEIDDVLYMDASGYPEFNYSRGDYFDWIDIVTISISGNDILVTFQSAGNSTNNRTSDPKFTFSIGIDVDNDDIIDFSVGGNSISGYQIINEKMEYWNESGNNWYNNPHYHWYWDESGNSWSSVKANTSYSDIGSNLIIGEVVNALAAESFTLSSSEFRARSNIQCSDFIWYSDSVPYDSSLDPDSIHGFQLIPILFSILTLLAMVSIFKNKKF